MKLIDKLLDRIIDKYYLRKAAQAVCNVVKFECLGEARIVRRGHNNITVQAKRKELTDEYYCGILNFSADEAVYLMFDWSSTRNHILDAYELISKNTHH